MSFSKCLRGSETKALNVFDFKRLFEDALSKIPSKKNELQLSSKIALAVSGGPDSMALAALASELFGKDRLTGLIVDHQLQDFGVTENTALVQERLHKLGIPSSVIKLQYDTTINAKDAVSGKLMSITRDMRYRALLDECKRYNSQLLLTGHNLEDDIVTMFYRISRMSGLDGLGGMKKVSIFPFASESAESCFIMRPFLEIPKARLINTCIDRGVSWTQDESNNDLSFKRNECLQALIDLQKEKENVNLDSLKLMLDSFKKHRVFIHEKVSKIMAKSVILNRNVGETTLILNDRSLIANSFLFNRVLTFLVQFVTVNSYPPKTVGLQRIFDNLCDEYEKYQMDAKKSLNRNYAAAFLDNSDTDRTKLRRIGFSQHTLAGATVYALSKNDTHRRLNNLMQRTGKTLDPGPGMLIQREKPSKRESELMNNLIHDFSNPKPYHWDNRIFLSVLHTPLSQFQKLSLKFNIRPLNIDIVKKFEGLTKSNFSLRKNLYSYLGMTPNDHLHSIPVLIHEDSDYIAIPTLSCYSDSQLFRINFHNSSLGVYASKFVCLP